MKKPTFYIYLRAFVQVMAETIQSQFINYIKPSSIKKVKS